MKRSKFTETQIVAAIKKNEAGVKVSEICRELKISEGTFYNWKAKYGGMEVKDVKRLKDLEEENNKLKRMFADLSLENHALKDLIEKKL